MWQRRDGGGRGGSEGFGRQVSPGPPLFGAVCRPFGSFAAVRIADRVSSATRAQTGWPTPPAHSLASVSGVWSFIISAVFFCFFLSHLCPPPRLQHCFYWFVSPKRLGRSLTLLLPMSSKLAAARVKKNQSINKQRLHFLKKNTLKKKTQLKKRKKTSQRIFDFHGLPYCFPM